MRLSRIITDYRLSEKRCISAGEMYSTTCIEWGRWSFWFWFDVNRSTLDEHFREKQFYIFVPSDVRFDHYTSNLLLCCLSYPWPGSHLRKFLLRVRLSCFKKIGGMERTDRRTVATRPPGSVTLSITFQYIHRVRKKPPP